MSRWSRESRPRWLLLCFGSTALLSSHASAEWPPPESANAEDMRDPANWPNDPGYGYNADEKQDGQWNYYSFIPEPSNARPEEEASGMSIDLAWRLTTGHPSVVIAITDSGIKWDEADLIEAAFLNHRELVSHRPAHTDGSACAALNPEFYPHPEDTPEALSGFDCNDDGVLTVADYADTPSLLPAASDGVVKGDINQNGVLDPGDIIINYTDGVDDDLNGYVDDISGWDFFKNDNDPYDDTRYGHGTGEGRDSTARANNGIGGTGGCVECRMLQLRVGDSFIANVNDFGQAVVYATDMKARVVQSALGTINNNRFTQAALDYAYQNNVLTVASMADENSRHHNQPTASNHTLPVHAIQYAGSNIFSATSFLAYHPCSNFGGQNFLSASGTGCSSEAVGQLSGIAGLVFSAARKYNVDLTPGEAMSLFFMTADDIDVPESQQPEALYKWSQPGFDQRFGYGRVNANTAVEWVRDRRIPPSVDITSPTWFSVLYKDQVEGPIDIVGRVSAKRAKSYDVIVEWAPGVQPLEGAFTVFHEETNIPQDVVLGSAGPLASLDIRSIDPTHEWDIDSPLGENQYTITVRVRALAHYGGDVGDVPGEMRRTYYVHSDPSLVRGFPIYLGDSGESSPKLADLDGDGVREIVYATAGGDLHVFKITSDGPKELPGFPFRANILDGLSGESIDGVPSYLGADGYSEQGVSPDVAREALVSSAPAIADLDGDGVDEIVVTSFEGTVYVVQQDGTLRDGWPRRLPLVPSCPRDPNVEKPDPCMDEGNNYARGAFGAPVLEDMDGDGDYDVIQAAFDGKIYVFDEDGEDIDGFPYLVTYRGDLSPDVEPNRIFTTPATADFNGDGIVDLLVGSNEKLGEGENSGAIYLVDGRGNNADDPILPGWPITMTSLQLFPLVAEGVPNSGVIGTFEGTLAAVMHGNATLPLILPEDPGSQPKLNQEPSNSLPQKVNPETGLTENGIDPSSQFGPLTKAVQPNTMLPLFSQPSLGDMDQDGVPDLISPGGSLNLAINIQSQAGDTGLRGDSLLAIWSGRTGAMLPAAPMLLEDFTFFNSATIADLSNDGYPEAVVGSGGYYVHAFDGCGREPEGWPKFTGHWITEAPAIGDIDGDNKLEVVVGTRNGWLYAWHTDADTDNVIEWESYHHDNRNTGNLNVPLDQGGPSTAAEPLALAMCEEPTPDEAVQFTVAGGCSCRLTGVGTDRESDRPPHGWLMLGLAGLAVVRRRLTSTSRST